MVCESKSTALADLKQKGILGQYNDILDLKEFEAYNKELTRFSELKYNIVTDGEMLFNIYKTETKFPYSSSYLRDDIQVTRYAQPNDDLFEAVDNAKIQYDILEMDLEREEGLSESDFDIEDPMFLRNNANSNNTLNKKFKNTFKKSMLGFIKGLNIEILEDADHIFDNDRSDHVKSALSGFDMLQKFLALRTDITDKDLALQSAYIIFNFLGKKSKLGGQLYRGINNWSKYKEVYDKYANRFPLKEGEVREKEVTLVPAYDTSGYGDIFDYEIKNPKFNSWAHKQVIYEFMAEMLLFANKNDYIGYKGEKRFNPDIDKEFLRVAGYKDKFEEDWIKRVWNKFLNFIREYVRNKPAFEKLNEGVLTSVALDIIDDVYKKDYKKFIRKIIETKNEKFVNTKGEPLEIKDYQKTLDSDPFANDLIDSMTTNEQMGYKLSGSQVLRKYGRLIRPVDEDLHDIDGVITLEQFKKEKNNEAFREYIVTRGLELMKKRFDKKNQKTFIKEITPFLNEQTWYKEVKKLPGWELYAAFIGADHKNGESITITGYVVHPTETEVVDIDNLKGHSKKDVGKVMPKRYVLDFFLRTEQGKYPEIFDNYWKDWKEIMEAKMNMGRAKDLADLIHFIPFYKDKYNYTKKGFRFFTFGDAALSTDLIDDSIREQEEISPEEIIVEIPIDTISVEKARAQEIAEVLGERLAAGLKVNFVNISETEARTLLESRKKPYNGEAAFFYGRTVYIVGDNMNMDTVLHEFSHPLLRAISIENPVLFNNLYNLLLASSEGRFIKQHVIKNYPELLEIDPITKKIIETPLFKEEVLAYGLQLKASNKVTKTIETEGFENFIGKLLYAIRQIFKNIFGPKTKVAGIDESTTLEELADKLLGDEFEYETDYFTDADVVSHVRNMKEMANDLTKGISDSNLQSMINEMYATTKLIYDKARNYKTQSPYYQEKLKEAMFEKGSTQLLPRLKSSLQGYITISNQQGYSMDEIIQDVVQAQENKLLDLTNRSRSFVNSVYVVNNITKNIYKDLDIMQKSKSFGTRDAVTLLYLYRNSLRSWDTMFETFDELVTEEAGFDIDQNNALFDLMNEVKTNILRADNKIKEIYKENGVDFYVEISGYINEFLKKELQEKLKNALTNKLKDSQIQEIYDKAITQKLTRDDILAISKMNPNIELKYIKEFADEYQKFNVNIDKITDGLSGKLKDVSWFNRMFESYASSNDPIVGGLATFIDDQRIEAQQTALNKSYKFRNELEKILPKVGFNKYNTRQLVDLLMFKDTKMILDKKTKLPTKVEVLTFLNEFKDYRYDLSKLEYDLTEALDAEDEVKIKEASIALKEFNKDYMQDEFVPEFYLKDEIFDKYPPHIGKAAWVARKIALDAYNNEQNEITDELERFQKYSTLQELWRKYQMLYSLRYEDGTAKFDDPEKGIYDLSIANVLNEYKAATKDYYEFTARPGSLQTSFNEFLGAMETQDIERDSPEFEQSKQEWIKQNTRVVYTDEFYTSRTNLIEKLRALQTRMNEAMKDSFDMAGAYNEIFELMFAFKDEQGQPMTEALGVEKVRLIKDLNQKIIDYKALFDQKSGLSKEDSQELDMYIAITKQDPTRLTDEQKKRYKQLLDMQTKTGLSLTEVASIQSIYAELSTLTQKLPTEYYINQLNEHLQRLNVTTVTEADATDFINSDEMRNLVSQDERFLDWFADNHVSRKVRSRITRKTEIKYERSMVNSVSVPKNEKFYKTTEIIDEVSGKKEIIQGVPNSRHSTYTIKNKYRTGYNPTTGAVELIVGEHIDNRGQFLPKRFNNTPTGAKSSKYINDEYLRLKQSKNTRFELLELMKNASLDFQDGKSNSSKLYLDMPRYVNRDRLAQLQSGELGNKAKQFGESIKQGLKDSFVKAVDDAEKDYNYDKDNEQDEFRLVNTDLNAQEVSYVPVTGMYDISINNTDPDVIRNLFRYMYSLESQSKLLESLPLVNSILDTLDDPKNAPKSINKFSKNIKKIRGKLQQTSKPGATNNRLEQVRSLINREYYGVKFNGKTTGVVLDKFIGKLQKISATASLAVNIPSDLKNRYGQIVQNIIEAAGGEFITVKDLAQSRLWAATTMLEWSSRGIYAKGVPALSTQLVEIFDSSFKTETDFGRSVSRNRAKDLLNGSWMYDIRKFGEMEASLQLFGAFLNATKVEQKTSNGKVKILNYKDAWELDPVTNIARLKPGVDAAWSNLTIEHTYQKGETLEDLATKYSVTVDELKSRNKIADTTELEDGQDIVIARSEKFKQTRKQIQEVSRRLYGAYDEFSQAEGNLYLPYRMFIFMRKWFTPMFTNRFGGEVDFSDGVLKMKVNKRYNYSLGKTTIGFYWNAFKGLTKLVTSKGKYYQYMPADQKRDMIRFATEGLKIIMLALISSMMFGYDPDDKERFKKLKARSGALGTDEFKTWGFIQNHALILTLGVLSETSAFVPLPKIAGVSLGLDDYIKVASTTTSAFANTISLYAKIFESIFQMSTGNEKGYYSSEQGPYPWQQEDAPKVIGQLLRTVGITGSSGAPDQALEAFENASKIK